jgi:peptide/nickel transport system ATP-binding protein
MVDIKDLEKAAKEGKLEPPYSDYTRLLLSSVPEMDPDWLTGLLKLRAAEGATRV